MRISLSNMGIKYHCTGLGKSRFEGIRGRKPLIWEHCRDGGAYREDTKREWAPYRMNSDF